MVEPEQNGDSTQAVVLDRRSDELDEAVLLTVLADVKKGDFSVRMPLTGPVCAGKIADTLNDVIAANQTLGDELARVSRVVGKEGKLSQRVALRGSDRVWSESDRVGQQPDRGPRASDQRDAAGHRRGRRRRSEQEDHRRRPRRDARAQEHHQRDGGSAQPVHLGGDPRGPRGRDRGQARSGGGGDDRGRRRMEGPDRQRQPDGRQPHRAGPQHRRGDHGGGQRRPEQEDLRRRQGRVPAAEEHGQRDGRSAQPVRLRGDPCRPRGRRRGQARRPGPVGRGRRRVEGPDRQRQPAGGQPDQPGAGDRRRGHGGHRGRSDAAGRSGGHAERSPS